MILDLSSWFLLSLVLVEILHPYCYFVGFICWSLSFILFELNRSMESALSYLSAPSNAIISLLLCLKLKSGNKKELILSAT